MNQKPDRIVFLDLMRALAVIMMVQGHTIESFLSYEFRDPANSIYNTWVNIRGFTAPIFIFTAGVVFTYLFKSRGVSFKENPRVKKGVKRGLTLLLIGYFLRFPTLRIFNFSEYTESRLLILYTVDALHLIGIGLLALLGLFYISEKIKIPSFYLSLGLSVVLLILYPIVYQVDWSAFLPLPLAAYFYDKTGSLFPLMPWLIYIFTGSMLGGYLSANPGITRTKLFSLKLIIIALVLLMISVFLKDFEYSTLKGTGIDETNIFLVVYRIAIVLILNGLVALVFYNVKYPPAPLMILGRYSLEIYVFHLMIVYGTVLMPGLNYFWDKSFTGTLSAFAALLMIILMTLLMTLYHRLKNPRSKSAVPA